MSFSLIWELGRDSILAMLVAGALCAFLGVHILLRRVVFVSAAVTQASGLGIAIAFFLASFAADPEKASDSLLLSPQLFSVVAAVVCALWLARASDRGRIAAETRVGLGWVVTSALFLLVLSSKRIVQEAHQVDDLLYGSAILVTNAQLMTMAWVAAGILLVHVLFFKELVFISFDAEMAQTLGYRTQLWNALLFATLGIGVSFSVRTLGALPVFGFLVIPGAVAQLLVRRVVWAFVWAVAIALMAGMLGYYLAFSREWPTGPALVTSAALFLIPATLFRAIWKRA